MHNDAPWNVEKMTNGDFGFRNSHAIESLARKLNKLIDTVSMTVRKIGDFQHRLGNVETTTSELLWIARQKQLEHSVEIAGLLSRVQKLEDNNAQ